MKHNRKSVQAVGAAIGFAVLMLLPASAETTGYRISPGEVIEIKLLPFADRTQRLEVQADGTISMAEAGSIAVAGLTPQDLQSRLEMILTNRMFRVHGQDGTMQTVTLEPGEISSSVVAYKPVYVTGDVLAPGEHAYRPVMTARQVIAVSGGFSMIQAGQAPQVREKIVDGVDAQRDYELAWVSYLKEHFRRERLRAEFAGRPEFDQRAPQGSPLSPKLIASIVQAERDELTLSLDNRVKQQDYLDAAVKAAASQIATLEAREKVEADAQDADEDDVQRMAALLKTGATSNARLAEVRRFLMFSSSRRLSTSVELQRMRSQRADLLRQVARTRSETGIGLLSDLREVNTRLADSDARLRAARTKLQSMGVASRPLAAAPESVEAQITIVRRNGDDWLKLVANAETEVLPGDVVEVTLCSPAGAPSRDCPTPKTE